MSRPPNTALPTPEGGQIGWSVADQLLDLLTSQYLILSSDPAENLRKLGLIFIRDALGTRLDLLLADTLTMSLPSSAEST